MKRAEVKDYFKVLSADFPEWLNDYIGTERMQAQKHIAVICGVLYSDLFNIDTLYSSLDHSIAVALIVWHFTQDKKQTLAGLLHDITTPAFKHCVDFLYGDYEKQEATEGLTAGFIRNSKDIMKLLERDGVEVDEVDDYHIYPIADNDTPRMSADRLEYSLAHALYTYKFLDLDEIKKIYDDIEVQQNEDGEIELGFKTKAIARKFVEVTSRQSVIYRDDKTRFSMKLISDILKGLSDEGKITIEELYSYKDSDVIKIIEASKYKEIFETWRRAKEINVLKEKPNDGCYYVHQKSKIRYIDPLCRGERISKIDKLSKTAIDKNLSYSMDSYVF